MPRKKKAVSREGVSEASVTGNGDIAVDGPSDTPSDTLGNLFEAMGDDSYVNIRRRDSRTTMLAYCGRLSPAEAREEVLKERGGGGTYNCREMVRNPDTGQFHWGRQRTIYIEGPSFMWKDGPQVSAGGVASVPLPGPAVAEGKVTPNDVLTAAMLDIMRAGREGAEANATATARLLDSVSANLNKGGETPRWVETLIPLLVPLVERIAAPAPAVNPMEMMLAGMKLAREMGSPVTSLKEQFEAMEAMLDLKLRAKELEAGAEGGTPSTGDPLLDIVQQNLPRVLEFIGQLKAQPGAPSPAPVSRGLPPGVGVVVPQATIPPTPAGETPMWMLHLNNLRKPLLSFAQAGKDPQMVAEHVLELMLPTNIRGDLTAFLLQGEPALAQFLTFAPEFQPYQAWVADVMDTMLAILHPEEPEGEPEPGGAEPSEAEPSGTS